jgi:phosphoribosylanthranilate isomerase
LTGRVKAFCLIGAFCAAFCWSAAFRRNLRFNHRLKAEVQQTTFFPGAKTVVAVKICGLKRIDDALACAAVGVDWIGFNFHTGSPRFIQPAQAKLIIAALPCSVTAVGVFVDRPPNEVADLAEQLGLTVVQLHGREPPEDLLALRQLQVVRAFRLRTASDWSIVNEYLARARALSRLPDAILIDAYVAGQSGGTGATVASDVLDSIPPLPRLILAGGLTPENVAAKVACVQPWMVDVASGVESAPGRKDPAKVAAFVNAARSAAF